MAASLRSLLLVLLVSLMFASRASAQGAHMLNPMGVGQAQPMSFPGMMPGQFNGNAMGINPQVQQYMMLRALQSRGHHHGVQTGVPDPIIGGGPQFSPYDYWADDSSVNTSGKATASEKRAAAREAREQQKQLARDRAESKKAKATSPPAKAKARFNAT